MNAHENNSTQSDDNYAKQILHRSGFTEARKPSSSGLLLYDRHIHHVGTSEPSIGFLEICLFMLRSKPQAVKCVATEQSQSRSTELPCQPEQYIFLGSRENEEYNHSSRRSKRSSTSSTRSVQKHQSRLRDMARSTDSAPKFHHNILYPNNFLQMENLQRCELIIPPVIHLGAVIQRIRKLGVGEADCCFKQLVCGINYLHNAGVAHRDLKPENLHLTSDGVLKITHFSAAEWFRQPWETAADVKGSKKRCGSVEYLAPEVFHESEFDPRPVDMWAAGIIYMEMRMGKRPWDFAAECANEGYDRYLRERNGLWGYRPIENLKNSHCRRVISSLLDPSPTGRMTAPRVLKSHWSNEIELCKAVVTEQTLLSNEISK